MMKSYGKMISLAIGAATVPTVLMVAIYAYGAIKHNDYRVDAIGAQPETTDLHALLFDCAEIFIYWFPAFFGLFLIVFLILVRARKLADEEKTKDN